MADVKTKITVTLTEGNIKEAIAAWLNDQPTIGSVAIWEPDDVEISVIEEWRGNGTQEYKAYVTRIEARK